MDDLDVESRAGNLAGRDPVLKVFLAILQSRREHALERPGLLVLLGLGSQRG